MFFSKIFKVPFTYTHFWIKCVFLLFCLLLINCKLIILILLFSKLRRTFFYCVTFLLLEFTFKAKILSMKFSLRSGSYSFPKVKFTFKWCQHFPSAISYTGWLSKVHWLIFNGELKIIQKRCIFIVSTEIDMSFVTLKDCLCPFYLLFCISCPCCLLVRGLALLPHREKSNI